MQVRSATPPPDGATQLAEAGIDASMYHELTAAIVNHESRRRLSGTTSIVEAFLNLTQLLSPVTYAIEHSPIW